MSTQQSIINYIAGVWLDGDAEGLDAQVPLAELNIIDSAGIFDLVHYMQDDFRITVPLREISPANFRTVDTMAALVERLRREGETVR
ncbi:acyl carrier protein [Streptomyces tauricus]|uniref:Phosphopantetheine-binding protein n=1 Tax=Streptomyces tauricus TaxID=68274 RepID=A0ABZ1JR55_9ACTN|nr:MULTISPECIES: phosphopantetheine-binding protein [Streptomyces]MCW8096124.1 phosphopantetheine-binding protein [Streptomyces tauricus]UPZ33387.1 phosphopantetheine-binding protein [Streptomyces sp. LRE541]GHA05965.1 acyl carrier protein [Streptomyces tauricus]